VVNEAEGYLDKILASSGAQVSSGSLCSSCARAIWITNRKARAPNAMKTEALELRAMQNQTADLKPLRARLDAINKRLQHLEEQKSALVVRAKHSAAGIAPELQIYLAPGLREAPRWARLLIQLIFLFGGHL